ncbi:protein of unknown function (plasmid) [Cupriavidus taiwanensis]|nr:protein of unknown function [Cupriavidus taiwanensis]
MRRRSFAPIENSGATHQTASARPVDHFHGQQSPKDVPIQGNQLKACSMWARAALNSPKRNTVDPST